MITTAAPSGHFGRILIVEDEMIIAHDVRDRVTRLGYEVCAIVASGEQALEATGRHRPDIALMDIRLKGDMDGIEAAEAIAEHHQIPVIFLTGHSDQQTLQRAKRTTPFGYITKPFTERELSIAMEMALYRDAAQRQIRTADLAQRASETRMRAVVATAVDAIVITDEEGIVQSLNLSAERIFGYEADELIGQNVSMLMPETIRALHNRYIRTYLETGAAKILGVSREVEGRHKDGSSVSLELTIAAWSADGGRYFTGIMRDITERKRIEDELKRRNAELARANARLDQFAHIIGHDLRAPMRALSNSALWIIEDLAGCADEEILGHLQRISENRTRMYAMLDDLRDYSRAGLDPAPPQQIDLRDLVTAIQRHVETNIKVTMTVAGPVYTFVARRAAIDIVLRNLIENAIRHTDQDAVSVSIRCEDHESHLHFEISDDGPGIPPEFHTHIFTPFAKVDPNRVRGGSGMGLTLVKRVIEDNDGTIEINSKPSERRGTRFSFSWAKHQGPGTCG